MIPIGRIRTAHGDPRKVAEALAACPAHPIACNNWAAEYPYAPSVRFRMGHDGSTLHVLFEVAERHTMARVEHDQGPVWTDSCVECFIAPDAAGYYNFETNCIGHLLLSYRSEGVAPLFAPAETTASVRRLPSLGEEPFAERTGDNRWTLLLSIPARALFRHTISTWSDLRARMNLYKCGDGLSHPHFLSWRPIDTARPDFHVPRCFEEVEFQK